MKTIKEKAENYSANKLSQLGFIAGFEEAKKTLYNEEEVLEHLNLLYSMKNSLVDTFTDEDDYITMRWFEQFKKK